MTDAFAEGNSLFVDKKYEAAILKYTEAINLNEHSAKYFLARAQARMKVHRKDSQRREQCSLALEDCKNAILIEPTNSKAHARKG